jgi:hypothetical protein
MPFEPGRVIRRREVVHGLLWLDHPVTVVTDDGDCLAVLLEPGSAFRFHEHPFGPHPWSAHEAWTGSRVLQVHRAGDRYSVWKVFDIDGVFTHWYVNFEAPYVRHDDGYDTDDHGIDVVIPADGSPWRWKDVDDPAAMVRSGRITAAQHEQIRRDAAAFAALLDAGERWWSAWDAWCPPGAHDTVAP